MPAFGSTALGFWVRESLQVQLHAFGLTRRSLQLWAHDIKQAANGGG
jgi:hypothetical protein